MNLIELGHPRTPSKSRLVFNFPPLIPVEVLRPQPKKFSRADDLENPDPETPEVTEAVCQCRGGGGGTTPTEVW